MENALNFVKEFLISIGILISMVFVPYSAESYEAKNPENLKLAFNVVSDTHVETNNTDSYKNFEKVLRGMKANKSANANVFLGDNTMNGQVTENFLFFGAVGSMLRNENTLIALGNHDIGNGNGDYDKLINRYTNFHNFFMKNKLEKSYYYRVVNGCYMIFISSEKLCVSSFYMSDEQIQWFKDTLELAGKSENPIFIFSHHPLNYLENENPNLLFDICNSYDNVFSFHGHTHWNYYSYTEENVICTNLPRVTETVDYKPGTGVVVEVYENEIILRQKDFYSGEFLSENSFSIE